MIGYGEIIHILNDDVYYFYAKWIDTVSGRRTAVNNNGVVHIGGEQTH
jgi:hypothetical protein